MGGAAVGAAGRWPGGRWPGSGWRDGGGQRPARRWVGQRLARRWVGRVVVLVWRWHGPDHWGCDPGRVRVLVVRRLLAALVRVLRRGLVRVLGRGLVRVGLLGGLPGCGWLAGGRLFAEAEYCERPEQQEE